MRRRYRPGSSAESKGFRVWCEQGRESENDLRVMLSSPPGGGPVPASILATALDMTFEAEDIAQERPRYSQMKHFRGWKKMRDFCHDTYMLGPALAVAKLRAEHAQIEMPLFIEVDDEGRA
jgi:hypothetical protein